MRLFGEIASAQPLTGSGADKLRLWGIGIEVLRPIGETWSAGLRLGYEQERERGGGQTERETAIDAVLLIEPAEDAAVFEFYVGSRRSAGRSRAAWGVDVMREISDGVSLGIEFVGGRGQRPNTQARIEFEITDQWSLHLSAGRGRDGRVSAIGIEYALPLR
ncbi:MAG: translocation/assembly module TamB domain-containing protein [Burkholderiaceae bacterium]